MAVGLSSLLAVACALAISSIAFAADPTPGSACSINNAIVNSGGVEASGTGYRLVCVSGTWQAVYTSTPNALLAVGTNSVNPNVRMEIGGGLRLSPGASAVAGMVQLGELLSNGTNAVSLKAPDNIASDITITLPTSTGTSGWALVNLGNGTLGWSNASGSVTFPLLANPQGSASAPAYSFSNTTNTGMFSSGVGTLGFSTAGNSRLTITDSGNLGVGTATPNDKMEVHGGFRAWYVNVGQSGVGIAGTFYGMNFPSGTSTALVSNGNEALRIVSDGKVGIGTTTPDEALHVVGKVKATNFIVSSDEKFKRDIVPVESALNRVCSIRGVNYFWKQNEFPEKQFSSEMQYGVIAQEVGRVFPDLVYQGEDGLAVNYQGMIAPLIEAIKELNTKVDSRMSVMSSHQMRQLAFMIDQNARDIASLKQENKDLKEQLFNQQKQIDWLIEQIKNK